MSIALLRKLWITTSCLLPVSFATAQMAGPPTVHCHMIDGTFSTCPDGTTEWSDVKPLAFPATKSYLYVNQDSTHGFLYLMYDFPFRTAPLAPTESVHVSFDTVSQDSGTPGLEVYDIFIFGDGQMQILENGQPTPAGRIAGAAGFGPSPGSSVPHVRAELQVPLTPGPPTSYSPDPLFWSATVPPTPTPPPPPPSCPLTVLGVCVKSQDQIDAWTQQADADLDQAELLYTNGVLVCDKFGQQTQAGADAVAQAALADATSRLDGEYQAVAGAANQLVALVQAHPPNGGPTLAQVLSTVAPNVVPAIIQLANAAQNLAASAPISDPKLYLTVNISVLLASRAAVGFALDTAASAIAAAGAISAVVAAEVGPLATALAAAVLVYNAAILAEIVFANAVQAVAQAVATAACLAALDVLTAPYFAKAAYYELLAEDPPDPNFTVIALPVVPSLPGQPLTTTTGFSQQVVNDLNALIVNAEQQIALLQVIPISVNRVSGAVAAGNQLWQQRQAQAVQQYASQLVPLENNEASLRAALANDLTASGLVSTFTSNNVFNFLGPIPQNGLPSGVTNTLAHLGVDATTQAAILKLANSTSSEAVAALGSGAFPQALSDPTLLSSANTTITALNVLAASPPANSLSPSLNIAIAGDYTAAGVGLRGETGGGITISGVPSGGTVVKALLYWGMLDNGEDASLSNMVINGTPITGIRIGTGPDTCWGRTNSFSYRADVTPLVSGNGKYILSGVASGGNILAEGASLVVIYQVPGAPAKTVMLSDGNVSISGSPISTAASSFTGFTASAPVTAFTTFMVGDGQVPQAPPSAVSFSGNLGTLNIPNLFSSRDGLYWDTALTDVSSVIGAGNTSDVATISLTGDCLLWTAQAFSISTSPNAIGPVTATAAVVQANPDGNTVVNVRGLAPGDAPTLQQQIQMIIQSEIIQNPSLSATQLATQLVNSLPPNILPPDQRAALVAAIVIGLVLPPPPPSPANLIVTRTLTRSGNIISVKLNIANNGGLAAGNVVLSNVTVGIASASPSPQTIGTIPAGGSAQVTVTVPGSTGGSGTSSSLTAKGTYSGGIFSVSSRITLP